MTKHRAWPAVVCLAASALAAGFLPATVAGAIPSPSRHAPAARLGETMLSGPLLHAALRDGSIVHGAPGENPPGRVTQDKGLAGYLVPDAGTTSDHEIVTIPTVPLNCASASSPQFPNITSSQADPGMYVELSGGALVETTFLYNCHNGEWDGTSTLDPNCNGSGFCPYESFLPSSPKPGDNIEIQVTTSASGTSTTLDDLTNSSTISYSGAGTTATGATVIFAWNDYCFLSGGDSEPCVGVNSNAGVQPPGFENYSPPFSVSGAEVDGTALGSYLSGPSSTGWQQINSVWGSTLTDETSYVGSGSSFTVTNSETTLPGLSVSSPSIDKPATGSPNLAFVATLAFSMPEPVYLDYATANGSGQAGIDYTSESGTLKFPSGTTSETVNVPVISGPVSGTYTGNVATFSLSFTNPSYEAGNTSASGTIYEGPVVDSVSPNVVPLNGGGGASITVTGHDFGNPGTADTVGFCPTAAAGGGACLPGTAVTVGSDTSLTVNAADFSQEPPQNGTTVPTDTIVTNPSSVSSPVAPNGEDVLTYGCQTQDATDGLMQVFGCLTDETGGNDVTEQTSQIDGVDVSASPKDDVTYATRSGTVDSSGSVSISLALLNSAAVKIFQGKLNQALNAPVTFTVPANTKLAGLAISGSLTLTPGSLGQSSGTVTATLPGALGGGTATLTFETATNQGLSNLTISVPQANFMQLFSLTNVTLTYAPKSSTWSVEGTASTGGTTSTSFAGKLVYKNGALSTASLDVGSISLAGLLTFSKLHVGFTNGAWSGSGTVTQNTSSGKESATIALAFGSNGSLSSAEIKTGKVTLFGVINLDSFDMKYSAGSWSLDVASTVAGGGTDTASLSVSGAVISSATLTISDVNFLEKVRISTATISYSANAPNKACSSVTGTEIWCGSWEVLLPQATIVSGVSGSLAFADGSFAQGSISVSGNVPLAEGVFLQNLSGRLQINPQPTTVSGSATLTFGPQITGVSALAVKGTLTRAFPTGNTPGFYDVTGNVTALPGSSHSLLLGSVEVKVNDAGSATVSLNLGGGSGLQVSVGSATATITGTVTGTFTSSTFNISGTTSITVPVFGTLSGALKADNQGIAACAKTSSGKQVGFEYFWSNGSLSVFDTKGCTEKGF